MQREGKAAGKGGNLLRKKNAFGMQMEKETVEIVEIDLTIVSLACYWRNTIVIVAKHLGDIFIYRK